MQVVEDNDDEFKEPSDYAYHGALQRAESGAVQAGPADMPDTTRNNMISQNKMPAITSIERICKGPDITPVEFFSTEKLYPELTGEQQGLLRRRGERLRKGRAEDC